MKVYPAPGLRVRDPVTKAHISQEGHDVSPGDLFWARRVRDGDVLLEKPEYRVEDATAVVDETKVDAAAADAAHEEDDQS